MDKNEGVNFQFGCKRSSYFRRFFQPQVIANSLSAGVEFINHIRGFVDEESIREISKYARTNRKFILMYSHNHSNRAETKSHLTPNNVILEIVRFFRERKKFY